MFTLDADIYVTIDADLQDDEEAFGGACKFSFWGLLVRI